MIGALFFQIICIGISDSLSSQSSRAYVGAGESGRFPRMGQGALIGNDIKNIPDGCCYSYGGSSGDGSPISGPTLSLSAAPECKLQIKASVTGNRLMFRVRHIETRVWSDWTEISIKQ